MVSNITIEERIKNKALHDQGYGAVKIAKYFKTTHCELSV